MEQPMWVYSNSSAAGMDQIVLDPIQLEMKLRASTPFIETYTLRNGGTVFNIKNMDDQWWDALKAEWASLRNGNGPDAANEARAGVGIEVLNNIPVLFATT
ncbi:hypothetical protein BT96DRAFT_945695 [Gymnopus androsaceus JB14]|uniref:Uncharacterized protein n=1 Tax=Gymnopus androsaceus JB14 TaxID=1447944 RepID=A0A6A4H1B1_9AGAR|nr:hypothetical protein BT96DRAFT_945695 [Gymnopus androsaceus JB14]